MTSVLHQPRKQVIIHEMSLFNNYEEMLETRAAANPPGTSLSFSWVDGVLLSFYSLPITDVVAKEIIEGRLHWDHVSVAPMPEYKPTITLADRQIVANVVDVSANETFRAIGKFLKTKVRSTKSKTK